MVKEIMEELKARLQIAQEELQKLKQLINLAEEAGEDVTKYKLEARNLEKKIEQWENALSKYGGG